MVKTLKKNQNPQKNKKRSIGVIIDCDEIAISVFPPPREHGKPHCHVTSKKIFKVKGHRSEVFPEVKSLL